MLVDSHCHLEFEDFSNQIDDILQRAENNGVKYILSAGTRISEAENLISFVSQWKHIYCSVGVHPEYVEDPLERFDIDDLVELSSHKKVIAIGETGLDYYYGADTKDAQIENFVKHIRVCQKTGLPLIVHTRDADQDTIDILKKEYRKGKFKGVIHCFTAGDRLASVALDLGFYISFSGIITFSKSEEIRAIAQDVPLNRILVETDAPYLAPIPKRGKLNEPSYVLYTAELLAKLKDVSLEKLGKKTYDNFFDLFSKAKK